MARIYLDSNVFSNLKNSNEKKYENLRDLISIYRCTLNFAFSHAHIRDKINDTTDNKFDDFNYMETLVEDNYLSYHALDKKSNFYLATPLMVFQDNDALMNINFLMDSLGGSYKKVRETIESGVQEISYNNNKYNLNQLLVNGKLSENYSEFIKDSLHHSDKANIPYYDFYLHSYSILDILSISKEKLSKKNSYNNIFNDSLHSYYARYCDYLVTADEGLRKKTMLLYDRYNVSTKVLSIDEFISSIADIGNFTERDCLDFFKNLSQDLISSPIIQKSQDSDVNRYIIFPQKKCINFFDCLTVLKIKEDGFFLFFTKRDESNLDGATYKECQMIANRMVNLLGSDCFGKANFNFELEVEEMRNNIWKGRYWEIGDTIIFLHKSESSNELRIQIGPLSRWMAVSRFNE